ncbi:MAG: 3-oxoacyl-ACP synthase [Firmicutes bacterium]|nr:3-oxoacyl-ACP synthase [Bacillota bacterium]
MNMNFHNKKISGILCVVPKKESLFDDEIGNYNFPPEKSLRLKKIMGYDRHRIAEEGDCISDYCVFGMEYLLGQGIVKKEDIDAIILVTQTADYLLPPTSNIIQGRLGLREDVICLDINQGCAGYVVGLTQAFMLLEQESINKVILLNAEFLSHRTSRKDRNSYPIIGDAAAITIVEKDCIPNVIHANVKMDGSQAEALIIPAGGLRLPSTTETAIMEDNGDGNLRSKDNLFMDGTGVFNFVQTKVPALIEDLLVTSGSAKEEIDYYLFHQPNRFMLEKLADQLRVPYAKMPANIVERFGNSSGATIPVNTVYNLGEQLKNGSFKVCFCGFGTGLNWAAMLMTIGKMQVAEMIEYS